MAKIQPLRLIIALLLSLLLVLLLLLGLVFTDTVLSVLERLERAPAWLVLLVATVFGIVSLLLGWGIIRALFGGAKPAPGVTPRKRAASEADLVERLERSQRAEIDVGSAHREMERLRRRREAGEVFVALYGDISSGKSSLIRALLPGSGAPVEVTGGTTRELREYRWTSPAGDQLVVVDMPGTAEVGLELDRKSRQEAQRAHLVIYLCDGDLTRTQHDELRRLLSLGKPVIVALNKIDRMSDQEQQTVRARLEEHLSELGDAQVVAISAGGAREVVRLLPDGSEELVERAIPPRIDSLQRAVQRVIDGDKAALEQLRDSAVFLLVEQKLDDATARHRRERAAEVTAGYARKAVVGALAAMTPGTDLLIQGYLATQMVRELAALYEVPVRTIDTETLIRLVQERVRAGTALMLAVAGNACKAFPGLGTLAGGGIHAVAYGMLFDVLGRGIASSLETRGALHPVQIATEFEESIGEDLGATARRLARLVVTESGKAGSRD